MSSRRSCLQAASRIGCLGADAELIDSSVRLDVLELRQKLHVVLPFAVLPEPDLADHGLEHMAFQVGGELLVIEALGFGDRLGESAWPAA